MQDRNHSFFYAATRTFAIAAGNPLCPADQYSSQIQTFEETQSLCGRKVSFFGIDEECARSCAAQYRHAHIGSEPWWNLALWQSRQEANKPVRNSLQAARRQGCEAREVSPENTGMLWQCDNVRSRWLQTKHLPPLHFVAETALCVGGKRLFVVECAENVLAYSIASPIWSGVNSNPAEYRIEHFVRSPDAPNGTMELLICYVAETLAKEGITRMSLHFAPFSRKAPSGLPLATRSLAMERYLQAMERFGGHWYNARGLERFKAKFLPDVWKPLYCSFSREQPPMRVLVALAEAFFEAQLPQALWSIALRTMTNKPVASRRKIR